MSQPFVLRQSLLVLLGLAACLGFGGCRPPRQAVEVTGPPGFGNARQLDPNALALRMRVFHVQQIWAGNGYEVDGTDYRAKVSIWSYSQSEPAFAELFFHDPEKFEPAGRHKNSSPGREGLQIHFPISTFGPIIALMRSANEPVYLFYFGGKWAIGTSTAEVIGSE